MRVTIDGTQCMSSHLRGVGRYAFNLISSFIDSESDIEVSIFYNSIRRNRFHLWDEKQARTCMSRLPGRILNRWWAGFSFPAIDVFIGSHDIFHAPTIHLIPPTKGRLICTIHDLVPMRFPEYYPDDYLSFYRKRLNLIDRRADAIITVSESTKRDIINFMGTDPEKIFVIPEAPGLKHKKAHSRALEEPVLKKYRLEKPYILYVGGGERHKNIHTLVNVFKILKKELKVPHKLVLAGNILKTAVGIKDLIRHNALEHDIIFTGYVPDEDLPFIYRAADVFVFLSLYEGFGLVLLEAMNSGLPIVASSSSSIPEVAGSAALLVDPESVDDIRDAIMNIIEDKALANRLKERGFTRAKQFSWESTVCKTIDVYKKTMKKQAVHPC